MKYSSQSELHPSRALIARIVRAAGAFLTVVSIGVAGYVWLGDGRWTWDEALYMSVITLSTVGYGEMLEGMKDVPGARWFTVMLILAGTGALLYLMSALTAFVVEGDLRGVIRRKGMERSIDALNDHYILCGLGATGGHIAEELTKTGHPFVVIEMNPAKFERLEREHGINALHIIGDATEDKVLLKAGIQRARGLISSLTDDRDNLFVIFTARAMCPHLRLVAKTIEPDNERKMKRAGADIVVSPTLIGGLRMVGSMIRPCVMSFLDEMVRDTVDPHRIEEIHILSGSVVDGTSLREAGIRKHGDALVLAVRDEDGVHRYNPPGELVLRAGMILVVLVRSADVEDLRLELSAPRLRARRAPISSPQA